MAKHVVVLAVTMEDMDGTPEQSAEILTARSTWGNNLFPYEILAGYLDDGGVEVTYYTLED